MNLAGDNLNGHVGPLLTDLYQLTMAYAYWKTGKHEQHAVFDLFFRKNPFHGEFTVFAGLDECLKFLENYSFSDQQIEALHKIKPEWDEGFYGYLRSIDCSKLKVYAVQDGTVVFPREPLLRVEGPLGSAQLLETTLLVLVNYACLMATNGARHRLAAGPQKTLIEFGLRRAQGPDGAMSATKYAYLGGFDATSNVQAGAVFGIPVKGTHAHAFVSSFVSMKELQERSLVSAKGKKVDFIDVVLRWKKKVYPFLSTNEGELAAFIAYAQSYPRGFLALVDTYSVLRSGVPNFVVVALALHELGYAPVGIRLDSGDLAYQSKWTRTEFRRVSKLTGAPLGKLNIVASNEISEDVLYSLNKQGHEIDTFGVGTNLVTCKAQPALGGVYKLVEIDGQPRIKLSQDVAKVTIPGLKVTYRLFDSTDTPVCDLMALSSHPVPKAGDKVLCRHPFDEKRRVLITPSRVEVMNQLVWDGKLLAPLKSVHESRKRCQDQIAALREDHLRSINPTPYKVSVGTDLYTYMHKLWEEESPIEEIS